MMQRLFWIAAAGLAALALHLAYVLFMPGLEMGGMIDRFANLKGRNDLALLSPDEERLLPVGLPEMETAACAFDAASGPVTVDAVIPDSYWTISVYSRAGELLFTLDDRQAGLDRMRFVLRAPGGANAAEEGKDAISVESPDGSGLVLLQARAEHPAYGPRLREALKASTCGPRK